MKLFDTFKSISIPFLKTNPEKTSKASVRLSCDLGESEIVIVEVKKTPDAVSVLNFHTMKRPPAGEEGGRVIRKALAEAGIESKKSRISIKGYGVVIRFIQFPRMKPDEIRSAIAFEAEKYIPFKSEEVCLDFCVLDEEVETAGGGKAMNLLLVAMKRDEILPIVRTFQAAGLTVELIGVNALSFLDAVEFFYPGDFSSTVGALEIGSSLSTLAIASGGKPRFIRDLSFGREDLIKRIRRTHGLNEAAAAEQLDPGREMSPEVKTYLKEEGLQSFLSDLHVSLDYYLDQTPDTKPITKIFLGGRLAHHPVIREILSDSLRLPAEAVEIADKIKCPSEGVLEALKDNRGLIPVAMGLALRDL